MTKTEFQSHSTSVKVFVTKNHYPDLLTKEELQTILNITPLITRKRFVIEGNMQASWISSPWCNDANAVPPSVVKRALDQHICYLVDSSRLTSKLNKVARELEDIYNTCADAHIYINKNPKINHPFGIHFDRSDNLIVQCEGVTNFKVWEEQVEDTERNTNLTINKPPDIDVDLEPGDSIYIPHHCPHLATSKTPRFSVSFPMIVSENSKRQFERDWIEDIV